MTALFSLVLAVGDATNVADEVARVVGFPASQLPVIYILAFGVALLLVRHEYESADYDFARDLANEYLDELDSHTEFHRVAVRNYGHSPINVQVVVQGIDPLPPQFAGKLGMPLVPMGADADTDGSVVIYPGRTHSFNVVAYDYNRMYLDLWHTWLFKGAPSRLEPDFKKVASRKLRFRITLLLSPAEGQPKEADFVLVRERAPSMPHPKPRPPEFRLTRDSRSSRLDRIAAWFEQPLS